MKKHRLGPVLVASSISITVAYGGGAPEDATEPRTVTGVLVVGTLDSAIEPTNGEAISFITNSKVGAEIFETCKVGDVCTVSGEVSEQYDHLVSLTGVKLVEDR